MNLKSKAMFITLVIVLVASMVLGSVSLAGENQQQSIYAPPKLIVLASFLNVRYGPGVQYAVMTTVVGGTELPVLGLARDNVWYQVSTLLGPGWVNGADWTAGRGDFSHVPYVDAPPLDTSPAAILAAAERDLLATGGGIGGGAVEAPAMAAAPAAVAPMGAGAWGLSIREPHGAIVGSLEAGWTATLNASRDVVYPILGSGGRNGVLWYQIYDDWAGHAWVDSTKVDLRPIGCTLYTISFPGQVILGKGPDNAGVEGTIVPAGMEVYLIDQVADLYKVALMDGTSGWAFADPTMLSIREPGMFPHLCTGVAPAAVAPGAVVDTTAGQGGGAVEVPAVPAAAAPASARVLINTGNLNIRSGPGAQYTILHTVPGGTEWPVTGFAPDGVWAQVYGPWGLGWVNLEYTAFRGDGRYVPVIRDVTGILVRPEALITNAVTLYAAPNMSLGVVGTISGPIKLAIVARTPAFDWVQVESVLGFGWIPANQVALEGDSSLVPVVSN